MSRFPRIPSILCVWPDNDYIYMLTLRLIARMERKQMSSKDSSLLHMSDYWHMTALLDYNKYQFQGTHFSDYNR